MNEGHRGAQRDLERLVVHGLGADGVGRALAVDVVVAAGDVGGHEGVGEAVVGVAQAHDGVNVVLRGDGLAVGPLVVAQVERVDHAVIGHVVGLAAGGLDVVDRAVEVERAEQALMHVAQHDELVGVAHVVDVEGLQVVVLQVELLDGVGLALVGESPAGAHGRDARTREGAGGAEQAGGLYLPPFPLQRHDGMGRETRSRHDDFVGIYRFDSHRIGKDAKHLINAYNTCASEEESSHAR